MNKLALAVEFVTDVQTTTLRRFEPTRYGWIDAHRFMLAWRELHSIEGRYCIRLDVRYGEGWRVIRIFNTNSTGLTDFRKMVSSMLRELRNLDSDLNSYLKERWETLPEIGFLEFYTQVRTDVLFSDSIRQLTPKQGRVLDRSESQYIIRISPVFPLSEVKHALPFSTW